MGPCWFKKTDTSPSEAISRGFLTYRKEYVLGILSLMPLLVEGTYKGLGWLITIIAVYVGIPVLIWSLVVDRLVFLVIGIIRYFRESSGHMYYFEKPVGPPGFSRRILRDFRVLLFVFVLSATIVPQITQVTLANVRESKTAMAMNRMFAPPAPPTEPPSFPPNMPAPPRQTPTAT